jgi:UDP-2,3-diacylglucosamine pyrophosphatase LpxH
MIQDKAPTMFRSIFLSDFHIGAKAFNAPALLDFLRSNECQTLYLVGDIIDGWKLNKRWYWSEDVSQVFDELFRKAHEGTKIVYITGNHDEAVREISVLKRMKYAARLNIQIKNRIVHRTAKGLDYLVIHGDQFDRAILRGMLSRWSDRIYDFCAEKFRHRKKLNIEVEGKVKRFSLSKFLSYHGQVALNILNNFETALVREARRSDVQGIICGHTHIADYKKIGAITYANCGAWLKGECTAIVETTQGRIELLPWVQSALPLESVESAQYRPMTLRLMASIRRTWPSPHNATGTAGFTAPVKPAYAGA